MDKFTIFREMLDYLAHISQITDADMNYYKDCMRVTGEYEGQTITIDVTIENKEDKKNA